MLPLVVAKPSCLVMPCTSQKIDLSLLGGNMLRGLVKVRTSRCLSLKGTMESML